MRTGCCPQISAPDRRTAPAAITAAGEEILRETVGRTPKDLLVVRVTTPIGGMSHG
jgi:hypothetical protein